MTCLNAPVSIAADAGHGAGTTAPQLRHDARGAGNPILPGYFADPSIIRHKGKWYLYATRDPWGGDDLGVWVSSDFVNWTHRTINWPTKQAATSPTSGKSKTWAPSVVQSRDGRFWMYVSIGNEIWVGTADTPLGPWRDANGGKPLINRYYRPGLHMIDAEAFIDTDGTPYLYWGSGLNWVNGHCFVVRLKRDMTTFDGEPRDVTPAHYFEAPFMFKMGRHYILSYSNGNTTTDTYQVHYAVGDNPRGPFVEGKNSPILTTDHARQIISPGHHAIFRHRKSLYILYHRQALPFDPAAPTTRQIAVDRVKIGPDGVMDRVIPTHEGPWPHDMRRMTGLPYRISSSADGDGTHDAGAAADDNYATLWRSPAGQPASLQADLGTVTQLHDMLIRFEYPDRRYDLTVDISDDGRNWKNLSRLRAVSGSPVHVPLATSSRFVRLNVDAGVGIFEWNLR